MELPFKRKAWPMPILMLDKLKDLFGDRWLLVYLTVGVAFMFNAGFRAFWYK